MIILAKTDSKAKTSIDTTGFLVTSINADIQTADPIRHLRTIWYLLISLTGWLRLRSRMTVHGIGTFTCKAVGIYLRTERYIHLHCKEGVKSSNGADFKSDDVVYSSTRMLGVTGVVNGDFCAWDRWSWIKSWTEAVRSLAE